MMTNIVQVLSDLEVKSVSGGNKPGPNGEGCTDGPRFPGFPSLEQLPPEGGPLIVPAPSLP